MNPSVQIKVTTQYLGKQSKAESEDIYVFSYTVNISNKSDKAIQLLSRYWLITNGHGEKIEVSGDGVVGEQPHILPDQTYSYSSASMIKTKVGTMEGHYAFCDKDDRPFKAPIPVFSLAVPNSVH